jgi:DNA-binding transcriptional ArsR family regulator
LLARVGVRRGPVRNWEISTERHHRVGGDQIIGDEVPRRNGAGIELLADPVRRRIVAALALQPRRPSSLAAEVGLSRPAITRQLHLLHDAGLVRSGRSMADRRAILYALEPRRHGVITAWLAGTEIGRPTVRYSRDGIPLPGHELIERDPPPKALESPDDRSA